MIRVLFFAKLREALGCAELEWGLDRETTALEVRSAILEEYPHWREALSSPNVIVALNHEVVALDAQVAPGDELAFYPPVTGG